MDDGTVYRGFTIGAVGGLAWLTMSYILEQSVDWGGGVGFTLGFAAAYILIKMIQKRE